MNQDVEYYLNYELIQRVRELLDGDPRALKYETHCALIDASSALLRAIREQDDIMRKWAIESDESLTECVERNIDGWKQRCLRAEKRISELERERNNLRNLIKRKCGPSIDLDMELWVAGGGTTD